VLNSTVNIVTLDTSATALSAGASTSGALSCSTYPGVSLYVTRNAVNTDLADITINAGSSWTASVNFTALLAGDLIFGKLTTSGIGCTNELPLTVSVTYSPQAGLCDANPSACVTLTGVIAGTNGLPASNMTLAFKPSQMAFLGGVPPNSPAPAGGGACGGTAPNYAVCSADLTTEYGDSNFIYDHSTVIGSGGIKISFGSIANADENFGYAADAVSDSTIQNTAVGNSAQALGGGSVAAGYMSKAVYGGGVCSGCSNIAIGLQTDATGHGATVAIGDEVTSSAGSSVAIGDGVEVLDTSGGSSIIAIGDGVVVDLGGTDAVAIGDGVIIPAGDDSAIALGNGATVSGSDSVAVGEGATAAEDSIALGFGNAPGQESIGMGYGFAGGHGSTVIGDGTDNNHDDVVIVAPNDGGHYAQATAAGQAIIGGDSTTDLWLGNPTGPSAPVTIHNLAGGSAGHGICWKTDTTLGYCSSALDSSGNCTCN
jgi:hypothetical protein